jgi:hypothetical protein
MKNRFSGSFSGHTSWTSAAWRSKSAAFIERERLERNKYVRKQLLN